MHVQQLEWRVYHLIGRQSFPELNNFTVLTLFIQMELSTASYNQPSTINSQWHFESGNVLKRNRKLIPVRWRQNVPSVPRSCSRSGTTSYKVAEGAWSGWHQWWCDTGDPYHWSTDLSTHRHRLREKQEHTIRYDQRLRVLAERKGDKKKFYFWMCTLFVSL